MARLLLIAKFPPLVGGTAAAAHGTAIRLARLGHDVDVVGDGDEAPPGLRAPLTGEERSRLMSDPWGDADRPGTVAFHPAAADGEAGLLATARQVAEGHPPDVIAGWYLDPHGVAAAALGRDLDTPVVLLHAGSDLRIAPDRPGRAEPIRTALAGAAAVVTNPAPGAADVLVALGASPDALVFVRHPTRLHPAFESLDRSGPRPAGNDRPGLDRAGLDGPPVVLQYGKVGPAKGTDGLVVALARLAEEGHELRFVSVPTGEPANLARHRAAIDASPRLRGCSEVLAPQAPWAIPALLDRADLVVHLEHDFPVREHTSRIPLEALVAGRTLLTTAEVASAPHLRRLLIPDVTHAVAADPGDPTAPLRRLLTDAGTRARLAAAGRRRVAGRVPTDPRRDGPTDALAEILATSRHR